MSPLLRRLLPSLLVAALVIIAGYVVLRFHNPWAAIGAALWVGVVMLVANRRRPRE